MVQSTVADRGRRPDIGAAVRSSDHASWLRDVLTAIALESLERDAWRSIDTRDWDRLVALVGGPMESATDAAIERLERDLAVVLELTTPGLLRHVHEARRRAELGLD